MACENFRHMPHGSSTAIFSSFTFTGTIAPRVWPSTPVPLVKQTKINAPHDNDSIDESQSSRLQAADTSERNSESDEKMTR
jgi:hypothetical protein